MKRVHYDIYKKLTGEFPGEYWDGPLTLAEAKRKMDASYDDVFRIVKVTIEALPKKVVKK